MNSDLLAVKKLVSDAKTCLDLAINEVLLREIVNGHMLIGAIGVVAQAADFVIKLIEAKAKAEG